MSRRPYKSVFAKEILSYLDHKVSLGFKERSFTCSLRVFDEFCAENELLTPVFTRELADEWLKRREGEATTTHYSRINAIKQFLTYLDMLGFDVVITRDIRFIDTQFKPHIYSEDEIERYFTAVDAFDSYMNKKDKIQYPILFRLLYCCGTRINETLGIKKQDIDFDQGSIKLFETKNDCERFIVLGDDLLLLLRQFASKCFYLLDGGDYIFTSSRGSRLRGDVIYERHRIFLKVAGIPYLGGGEGPRLQDWRHSFAVYSFKQMIDAGADMYVALPVLSTYLGHKTIAATERYARLTMSMFPYIEEKFSDKLDKVFSGGNHEKD